MYLVASLRPSVRLSVDTLKFLACSDIRGLALPSATKSKEEYYQSKVFVCVSNNRTDAVDRPLISCMIFRASVNAATPGMVLKHTRTITYATDVEIC